MLPVHSTCRTSVGPSPRAAVPKAPAAQVCESAHTIVSPGRASPRSAITWWQMPWSPTSTKKSMPNCSTNARASMPALASATDGAGTAWSRITATRLGSAIRTGRRHPLNERNCMSISTTRSISHTTVSPGRTEGRPDARARIFSIAVCGPAAPAASLTRPRAPAHRRGRR